MKKITFGILIAAVLTVFVFSTEALGVPEFEQTPVKPSGGRATVVIPKQAIKVAPGVFNLGTALDNGKMVEGYAFVRYKKGFGKPGTECGNGICEPGENARKCPRDCANGGEEPDDSSTCYGFLAKGAKWKTLENYVVNPVNTRGLDKTFVVDNFAFDISKWEDAAEADILGGGSSTDETLVADLDSPDNKNEVYFADIDYQGAIGITIIWGIFGGPPPFRELVEWDQVYDDVDFDWSSSGEDGKMDFENIATHELGHSIGLADLYTDACSEQTMYGNAVEGETKKRTLEAGDVIGASNLYR